MHPCTNAGKHEPTIRFPAYAAYKVGGVEEAIRSLIVGFKIRSDVPPSAYQAAMIRRR
jgi:hypothetical protein